MFFCFVLCFVVSSGQNFALPRPFIARYLREGEREIEDLSGAGAPKGVTEGLVFRGLRVTASAEQCPN